MDEIWAVETRKRPACEGACEAIWCARDLGSKLTSWDCKDVRIPVPLNRRTPLELSQIERRIADGSHRNLSAGPRASTPLYKLIQPLAELGAPGPEKGAYTTLYCAASRDVSMEDNGAYFTPVGKKTRLSAHGGDLELARRLWKWTEERLREGGY